MKIIALFYKLEVDEQTRCNDFVYNCWHSMWWHWEHQIDVRCCPIKDITCVFVDLKNQKVLLVNVMV